MLTTSEANNRILRTCALSQSVQHLKYVSSARLEALLSMNIKTVEDLFLHVPHRYLDFTHTTSIALADVGQVVSIVGVVDKIVSKHPKPRLSIVEVYITDQTGVLNAIFFKQPWIANQIHEGDTLVVSGKVGFNYGFKQMSSPFFEVLGTAADASGAARVLPVHSVTEGLSVAWMRRIMSCAVAEASDVCDFLPAVYLQKNHLMGRAASIRAMHFPTSMHEAELARRRYAYDELLLLQIALLARKRIELAGAKGREHKIGSAVEKLIEALPFKLTDEQNQATDEILRDMSSPRVMNRLLLGDVGVGKTAVAAVACAAAKDTGTQVAFMAPTSVLATQHAEKLAPLLLKAGIESVCITGSMPAQARQEAAQKIADGTITVVFGTVALLSEDINFNDLSLVIIDEQHRFGVNQRARLRSKGFMADLLSMSATPIPRTLALSIYGDMDISKIAHRPFKTAPTKTTVETFENENVVFQGIEKALQDGHQAYVVASVIDMQDTSAQDMQGVVVEDTDAASSRKLISSEELLERYRQVFPQARVEVLHGRMPADEKDAVMQRFRNHETDILVATTVIEVGVDVPNATVMAIYDADRFGLATLHQLRGRVGRGKDAGRVFLVAPAKKGTPSRARLTALEETNDGFELARRDLELRCEGDILGYRQHGGASLRVCDMVHDADLIEAAHVDARKIIAADPGLTDVENRPLALEVRMRHSAYFEEVVRG